MEDILKDMDNQKITFRFAENKDFEDIAKLHFLDTEYMEIGFFNFFKDKIILFSDIGARMLVAQDKEELVAVIIFIKNHNLINWAFFSPKYIFKFFFRLITVYYGFSMGFSKRFFLLRVLI